MKTLICLAIAFFTINSFAQEIINESTFSNTHSGIAGRTNFDILNAVSYFTIYDNNSYEVRNYQCFHTNTQNDSASNAFERFFITPSINYNLPGVGIKLNIGYNISRHFSIMLSSGYMNSFTNSYSYLQQIGWDYNYKEYTETYIQNAEQEHQFIPIDMSLRYNLNVFGVQTYGLYQAGLNYFLKEGNYNITKLTKYQNSDQIIESSTDKATNIYNLPKTSTSWSSGIGVGTLIPFTNSYKIDISYSYYFINYHSLRVQSLGLGFNINIK